MIAFLKLLGFGSCITIFVVLFYVLDKKTKFGTLKYWYKQAIIGVAFGILAILSTEIGIKYEGFNVNVRDSATLSAGLIFGAPAGVIAGLIGGLERWLCVYWGGGYYTRLACALSTCFAGLFGGFLKKYLFDNKIPAWYYGFFTGFAMEVLHMFSIFITNITDIETAYRVILVCAPLMIPAVSITVMASAFFVWQIAKRLNAHKSDWAFAAKRERKGIAQSFAQWLFLCVLIAFIVTCFYSALLQKNLSTNSVDSLLKVNLTDVEKTINLSSDNNLRKIGNQVANEIENTKTWFLTVKKLNQIKDKYNVSEINIVNEKGYIIYSSNADFIGYNMASGEQSKAYMALLEDKSEIIEPYQPISYDSSLFRKYIGLKLENIGFVQVGYDADAFQTDIQYEIISATKNWHVGKSGGVIISNANEVIVSSTNGSEGKLVSDVILTKSSFNNKETFDATIDGEKYYCRTEMLEGFRVFAFIPRSEANLNMDVSVLVMAFMEIIIFVIIFILIYLLIKKIVVDNFHKINKSLALISQGNLNVVMDVKSNEEFAFLSNDINHTVDTLKRYIAEAEARIDKELEFAKQIQHNSLPSVFPPYPERTEFDIFASMDTAKEVGGDFYDFYFVSNDKFVFLIADVSGKGIPAALFMMKSKTLIKSLAEAGLNADKIFTKANEELCASNEAGMFVTAWLGILDLNSGLLTSVNGGHNPPLLKKVNGDYVYLKSRPGFVLAGLEGFNYKANEMMLAKGDSLYLYTDGVTEATAKGDVLYGEDRLLKVLNENKDLDQKGILDMVKQDLKEFVKEEEQADDITMLGIKYFGKTEEQTIELPAEVEKLNQILEYSKEMLSSHDCPTKTIMQVSLAIEEIFVNIANYAYGGKPGIAKIVFSFQMKPRGVSIIFIDKGIPYNPLDKTDPDITLAAEEREVGGLGIFMTKKIMDEMSYEYKDSCNILKLFKAY